MSISVTEIKRLLAEMTPQPWHVSGGMSGGDAFWSDRQIVGDIGDNMSEEDVNGVLFLVNAAPVLLEIVEALLIKEQSEAEAERARDAWRLATRESILAPSHKANAEDAESRASDAIGRLNAALAKVTR